MLNLVWVRSFLALAESRSFQGAANRLGLSQPTVSQQLQKLEGLLRVVLLSRARSGCELTPQGHLFLPYAQSLLRLNEHALSQFTQQKLRIGASSNIGTYLLQPHIKTFLGDRDPSCIDLVIDRNPVIADKLVNCELDIAVMEWWQATADLCAECWRCEPVVLIVHPSHPLAARTEVCGRDLAGLHLLGGEPGTGTGRLLNAYIGADERQQVRVGMQLGSTEAVKQAVKAGLGISLVLESAVANEVRDGSIRAIPLAPPGMRKSLFVAWRGTDKTQVPPAFVQQLLTSAR